MPYLPSPFDGSSADYRQWKNHRLSLQQSAQTAPLPLSPDLSHPADDARLSQLRTRVEQYGFAVYEWTEAPANPAQQVTALHRKLGLQSHDEGVVQQASGLSLLTDLSGTDQGRFIPYTAKAMGWHTDGYYNAREDALASFTLHCIQPAQSGGALTLLDPQLMLIALYDNDPQLVDLLSHPRAMMFPANKDELGHDRPARYSAVFFIRGDGTPGAHYTTRTRHIEWRTAATQSAAKTLQQTIEAHSDWQHQITLNSGQGVITRNVLHRRDAYTDHPDAPRRMLRGRFRDTTHRTEN